MTVLSVAIVFGIADPTVIRSRLMLLRCTGSLFPIEMPIMAYQPQLIPLLARHLDKRLAPEGMRGCSLRFHSQRADFRASEHDA